MIPPTIEIINWCNFDCRHCCVAKPGKQERVYINKKLFDRIAAELHAFGFSYTGITGAGEIGLHPELADLFTALARNSIHFEFLSNGSLFKEKIFPVIREPLIRKFLYRVGFSLDSSREEVHDYSRAKGSFRKIIEAIAMCKLSGIPFYIKTTVTNLNKDHLKDIVLLTSSLGAFSQSFIFPCPTKRLIDENLIPSPDETEKLFWQLKAWTKIFSILKLEAFSSDNKLFSCNAFNKFSIDAHGNYLICANLAHVRTYKKQKIGMEACGNFKHDSLDLMVKRHMRLLPEIVKWRLQRKDMIKSSTISLCDWCFYQFGKLEWIKEYKSSPWAKCFI
ncbi:MAG TPA: hypothetical protein DC049_16655 [Spirochaetia bacterium]|nr:hypothetical protein [Spirochaetia bacterium]